VTASSYGIVVEGPYDVAIFPELIRRVLSRDVPIISRPCFGKDNLKKDLLTHLRNLQDEMHGRGVEKALVIRDSDGKERKNIEAELARIIKRRAWTFAHGVHVCVIRREVETWLLADAAAVSALAEARGGRPVPEVQGMLEDIFEPKQRFKRLLSDASLDYTELVCTEIARRLRLETLRYRCPSFCTFEQRVLDC
jgi:hypothetical protein